MFHQTDGDPVDKVSRGFVRLDSLEGNCSTKMSVQESFVPFNPESSMKQTPAKAEGKWFGNYDQFKQTSYSPKSKYPLRFSCALVT